MSIHFGGRKIKTVYYGDKKIREAYLGSRKVWSSRPPEWQENTVYAVGDLVLLDDAIYRATHPHRSSGGFRPGSGTFWSSAWEYVSSSEGRPAPSPKRAQSWVQWKKYYTGDAVTYGDRLYTAKQEHWSQSEKAPGPDSPYWEEKPFF